VTSARPRISVVNDNADFLELMSAILDEDAGYDVSVFDGEKTSVAQLAESEPDLVIVDLLLGKVSGWELVTLSRAEPRLADVPIIVCSADVTSLRAREPELAAVANLRVLEKPFSIDELTELVGGIIGRKPAETR
jgi:CheY-like chemotaxis protein